VLSIFVEKEWKLGGKQAILSENFGPYTVGYKNYKNLHVGQLRKFESVPRA
jgi:hypothetical protein